MSKKSLFAALVASFLVTAMLVPQYAWAITPVNDRVENAVDVGTLPFRHEIDTSDATTSASDPDCFGRTRTVWYSFTSPAEMDVAASTAGSSYDTNLSVYQVGGSGQLTGVGCNDDARGAKTSRVRFIAAEGADYLIRVGGTSEPTGGSLVFTMERLAPPTHDLIENAKTIAPPFPYTDEVDVSEASASSSDPECQTKLRTVWYRFSLSSAELAPGERLRFSTDKTNFVSDYPARIALFEGQPGSLSQLACSSSPLVFTPEIAKQYYVMVTSTQIDAGMLRFSVEKLPKLADAPGNDDRLTALTLGPLPEAITLNTDQATTDPDDPVCAGGATRTVWFAFTPSDADLAKSRAVRIDTAASDYDTQIAIYQESGDVLNTVACDTSSREEVIFEPVRGQTYFILVEALSSHDPNNLRMTVENLDPTAVPPDLAVEVNETGFRSLLTGSAALQGKVFCTEPVGVQVEATVTQGSRESTASRTMQCEGEKPWSLNLFGSFRTGSASAEVTVSATGEWAELVEPKAVFEAVRLIECTQIGTAGRDRMEGTKRKDILCGLAGNDKLIGLDGDDRLLTGAGDDLAIGGGGNDFLQGAEGNDRLEGRAGNDRLLGDDGNDRLLGGAGDDRLEGGEGNDVMKAGAGERDLCVRLGSDEIEACERRG